MTKIQVVGAQLPKQEPGKHLWIVMAMFGVNPGAARVDLDRENLLTIEGPGCYWCEQPWSKELAHRPCKEE